nr:MAG TPA: hypothetical protein [Caudoviricetes sp.]
MSISLSFLPYITILPPPEKRRQNLVFSGSINVVILFAGLIFCQNYSI